MFERIKNLIGGIKNKLRYAGITDVAKDRAAISTNMEASVDLWMKMYRGESPWISANQNHTLNLPCVIASEIARQVTLEAQINITGENDRAAYIDKTFEAVRSELRRYVEYGCAGGGMMFKPYINDDAIEIDIVQADMFYPIAYNSKGEIISAAFVEKKTIEKDTYSRIEKHIKTKTGYIITNEVYKSTTGSDIGTPTDLKAVPEWAGLEPMVKIEPLETPLFAYFRIPQGNTVEPTSPLGVSVYARAINLIREADEQYRRYLWEFEGGELAIDVSEDAFDTDRKGKPIIPVGKERLWRPNKFHYDDTASNTDLFKTFSPELRDESLQRGLNTILQRVEDNCGLARGTLSQQDEEAKTATEIKVLKQRSYCTVTDIQKSLESAIGVLIKAIDALSTLYSLAPEGKYDVACVWDDSIIVDAETERVRDMQEVTQGLMLPYEYRMKWYGEDEETARAKTDEGKSKTNDELMGFGSTVVE